MPPEPEPTDPPAPGPEPKTFTQEQLDRAISDRLARERARFADYDDVKAKASKFDEAEAANQSAIEKAQTAAAAAEARAAKAEQAFAQSTRRSAIISAASEAGSIDPSTVAALLGSDDSITVDAAGNVTGAAEAVAKLTETKKFLFAATATGNATGDPAGSGDASTPPGGGKPPPTPGGADGGAQTTGTSLTRDALKTMTAAQIAKLDPVEVDKALAG